MYFELQLIDGKKCEAGGLTAIGQLFSIPIYMGKRPGPAVPDSGGVCCCVLQRVYLENVPHFLIRSRGDRLWGVCCCALQRVYLENVPHFPIHPRWGCLWGVFNTPLQQVQSKNAVHFGTLR